MAARQGLSAQISQASEDAKRAVLQRAPLKSSWFSNLNTTCTIKSAPPRTPEVLNLLGTKCGWLIKRNEQHVWQTRWCCVVPHTFLYYFDADIGVGGEPSAPPAAVQEALNVAVRQGFQGQANAAPRSSLYNVFPSSNNTDTKNTDTPEIVSDEKFNTLTPSGIIDLECYSAVHRSSENHLILELAGDDSVNPDLRSFYFLSGDEGESEEWTQALLSMRHQALVDEREAFREVCDGFAQQLQQLHGEMEDEKLKQEEAVEECYRVRSASEEQRRNCLRVIQEALERTDTSDEPFGNARRAYRSDLETVQQQNMGVLPGVQLLSNYTLALEKTCKEWNKANQQLKDKLRRTSDDDMQEVQRLRQQLQQQEEQWQNEKRQLQHQVSTLQQKLQQSQKQVNVSQHELTTQKGDLKTQLQTMTSHKKILKKEVVDLRQKLKELGGELTALRSYTKNSKMDLEQERKKGDLLNRYIEKMESQVRVQQNMMEMMSSSVVGSTVGSAILPQEGSYYETSPAATSPRGNVVLVRAAGDERGVANGGVDDDGSFPTFMQKQKTASPRHVVAKNDGVPSPEKPRRQSRGISDGTDIMEHKELMRKAEEIHKMEDDKSHVSELTEDRTQRQFDAVYHGHSFPEVNEPTPPSTRPVVHSPPRSSRYYGPPSFIGVGDEDDDVVEEQQGRRKQKQRQQQQQNPKLDTINNMSSASLGPPTGSARMHTHKGRTNSGGSWTVDDSSGSLGSAPRLSVAQRARLEADRKTTPVKIRVSASNSNNSGGRKKSFGRSPRKAPSPGASVSSQGSFFTKLENKIVAAIDNSVLGVPDELLEDALETSEEESDTDERVSSTGTETDRSLSHPSEEEKRRQEAENIRSEENRRREASVRSEENGGHGRASYRYRGRRSDRLKRLTEERLSLSPRQESARSPLSLEQRKELQRAKQIAFLKEQGLIKDGGSLRGGAGANRSEAGSNVSIGTSSSFSKSILGIGSRR